MKRSIISAVALAATAFAVSACGTGMNSQTAGMVAPVAGVSLDAPGSGGQGSVSLRNAALVYPGPQGFKAGAEATARAWLFNDTPTEQIVVIKYNGQELKRSTIKSGSFERAEVKFKVTEAVDNAGSVPVSFEWVGLTVTMAPRLPVAPPEAPVPGEKIELPAEPGAEGH